MANAPFQFPPELPPASGYVVKPALTRRQRLRSLLIPGLLLIPTLAASGGAGFWAIQNLLTLPDLPGCQAVSSIRGSASARLYCAEGLANGKTVENLRRAIQLIDNIPSDDPLHTERDRLMEEWSRQILELAEADYQDGKLEEAIKIAEKIPFDLQTHQAVKDQISQWRNQWERAEDIYQEAIRLSDQQQWSGAINVAKGLLTLDNRYWATTKHQEVMQQVQAGRDLEKMQTQQARRTPRSSDHSDPVEEFFAQRDRERSQEAMAFLNQARSLASSGTVSGLEDAINTAREVMFGTPQYDEAQQAIETWQDQIESIEDRPYLERAQELAQSGDVESIEAAIREARQVSWGRSLYDEAQAQIDQWQEQASQLRQQRQTQNLDNGETNSNSPLPVLPAGSEVSPNSAPLVPVSNDPNYP